MQIPVDILPQIPSRSDSGTGVRLGAGYSQKDSLRFGKAMEEALARTESEPLIADKKPGVAVTGRDFAPETEKKKDEGISAEDALESGAVVNQHTIVFILEGDKESDTDPDVYVDSASSAVTDATVRQAEASAWQYDTVAAQEDVPPAEDAQGVIATSAGAREKDPHKALKAVTRGDESGSAGVKGKASWRDPESDEDISSGAIGDVKARMPVAEMKEQHENRGDTPGFFGEGSPGPLENENNGTTVKTQKAKVFSETAEEIKTATKSAPDTANNTPMPLAQGIKPEQFRADQLMKQVAADAPAPVKAENLLDEMVSRIETMKSESVSAVSIQLKPEFLGKVALEIALDNAGLHVKINAADSGVRAMLNGQINTLIESLGNKGIEVVEVEVPYTGVDNGAFKEHGGDRAQPDRSRRQYHSADTVEAAAYYSVLPLEALEYYIDAGVSSVEYRA